MGIRGPAPKTSSLVIDEELDAPILRLLAKWQAIAEQTIAELETYDTVVKVTPNGHEPKRAHLSVLAEATNMVVALSKECGRTPASRVRLGTESEREPTDDELDLPPLPKRKRAPAASKPKTPQARKATKRASSSKPAS